MNSETTSNMIQAVTEAEAEQESITETARQHAAINSLRPAFALQERPGRNKREGRYLQDGNILLDGLLAR